MQRHGTRINIGLERCIADRPGVLDGARFGLLMNRASVDCNLRYSCDVLAEAFRGQLTALFTPQHGLCGDTQANMVETSHTRHPRFDIPVYSLYSETRRPTREMLSGLECLIVDLQDVGTRVYTFVWTVLNCLHACAEADIPVLILDRPNPLGGRLAEGPLLQPDFYSFVGGASIPMRPGLTMGEFALLLNAELGVGAQLEVVPLQGWSPSLMFPSLDRHWIPPSPNLPRFESALVYPGQVLLEGTNLSEGRGTTTPFEVVGAPFIVPEVMCESVTSFNLPGIRFLPVHFTPTFDKWTGKSCGGVSLHVTDAASYRPYRTTLAILIAVSNVWPNDFTWRNPPYEYETSKLPIDTISGSSMLRQRLDDPKRCDLAELDSLATLDESAWSERTRPHRLYDAT